MAQSPISKCLALTIETEEDKQRNQKLYKHYKDYILSLPIMEVRGQAFYRYKNLCAPMDWMLGAMVARQLFQAKSSDVILATLPKSGTTWLKALIFATENRNSSYSPSSIFTSLSTHDCVPFLELHVYCENQVPDLNLMPDPRLFSSHIPFDMLPDSIIQSGSFWDHVLGYWKASQEHSDRVMFMTYEEVMEDTASALRKMAEFIGCPFTLEEDKQNVVGEIVNMCSFENLSNLNVNKTGLTQIVGLENSMLYRRGKIGDWVNYLTPEMAKRLDHITLSKFKGTGLLN